MKKIIGYLRTYFTGQCNYRYLAALVVFVVLCISVNFGYKSEDIFIKDDPSGTSRLIKYLVGYFFVFGGAYFLQLIFDPKDRSFRNPQLWLLILFSTSLFAVRAWFYQHGFWVVQHVSVQYQTLIYKLITNLAGLIFLVIPCSVYWFFVDRKKENLYGLHARGVTLWPYFILILLMVPLLLWAGRQPDFQATYPRANFLNIYPTTPHYHLGTLAYEICYSLDYGVTEFFFRGFLIIAFARLVGYKSILPMCAFYVSIHFDKPLGECISSFFGGLILGILSFRTRSIYGGIIVHLGIALLMEFVGWYYLLHNSPH